MSSSCSLVLAGVLTSHDDAQRLSQALRDCGVGYVPFSNLEAGRCERAFDFDDIRNGDIPNDLLDVIQALKLYARWDTSPCIDYGARCFGVAGTRTYDAPLSDGNQLMITLRHMDCPHHRGEIQAFESLRQYIRTTPLIFAPTAHQQIQARVEHPSFVDPRD